MSRRSLRFPPIILIDEVQILLIKWATGQVFLLPRGQKNFQQNSQGSGTMGQFSFPKAAPGGSVWVSDGHGLRRIPGKFNYVSKIYKKPASS
jgi:hypothetical protein